jgi:hypothetical protein
MKRLFPYIAGGIVPTAVEFGLNAAAVVMETVRVLVLSHHRIRDDWGDTRIAAPRPLVDPEPIVAIAL